MEKDTLGGNADDHITIVFKQDNITTTMVARCKNYDFGLGIGNDVGDETAVSGNILDKLGIESVPFNELVPKCEQIRLDDTVSTYISCTVCSETYKTGEYKRKLNCGHTFHKKCVDKWLKVHFRCPLCRQVVGS